MFYPDGRYYEGEWKDGEKNGKGESNEKGEMTFPVGI